MLLASQWALTFIQFLILFPQFDKSRQTGYAQGEEAVPFYKEEQDILKKILRNYDKNKAEAAFIKRKGTFYMTPSWIIVRAFSEQTYTATVDLFLAMAWKDSTLKTWNASDFGDINTFEVSRDKRLWVPDLIIPSNNKAMPMFIMIRRDGIIYISRRYRVRISCWPSRGSTYPREIFFCPISIYHSKELKDIKTKCVQQFYHAIYGNMSIDMSVLKACDKKYLKQSQKWMDYSVRRNLKKWKTTKFYQKERQSTVYIYFRMQRIRSNIFATDIAASFAVAILLVCQFLMPVRHSQRLLVTLLGVLMATENVDAVANIRRMVPGGSLIFIRLDLSLLLMQVLALMWCIIAWGLQARSSADCCHWLCQRLCPVAQRLRQSLTEIQTRQRDLRRMRRLVEEADEDDEEEGTVEESGENASDASAGQPNRWQWEEIVLLVDRVLCALTAVVVVILFIVFCR